MRKGRIDADSALIREKFFGIRGYLFGCHSAYLDIGCHAVKVLGIGGAADRVIMQWRAIGGCDGYSLAKVGTYLLKHAYQLGGYEDRIAPVLTGKLPDAEIRRNLVAPVFRLGIYIDRHGFSPYESFIVQLLFVLTSIAQSREVLPSGFISVLKALSTAVLEKVSVFPVAVSDRCSIMLVILS